MSTEHVVAHAGDLNDGEMKSVEIGDRTILLVRLDGRYRAFTPECPHHGAPLAEGVMHDHHIRCPWHQSVFDARDGSLVEPPSLDGLAEFDVRVEGDEVIVALPDQTVASRPPVMAASTPGRDGRTFIIIGGGASGLMAAQTLRHEGFLGRLVMLTREHVLPYDRTELSKRYLAGTDRPVPTLRDQGFFDDADIEILFGENVIEADLEARSISCQDGLTMTYDRLLIATGGVPRRLGVEGEDLGNVFLLRTLDDCNRIRRAAPQASTAVVVGASFIGMEVAAALRQRGLDVTVVAPDPVPFARTLGEPIGAMYRRVHEDEGTRFRLGDTVERFEGDGAVRQVVLAGGDRLEADLVVIGVGIRPATGFVEGVAVNDDQSLSTDAHLRIVGADGAFASGDIARWPDWRTGRPLRIEHWRLALQLGMTAGRTMMDLDAPYRGVPFFWTAQHRVITSYVGYAAQWDDIAVDGDVEGRKFVAYYLDADRRVLAAAGCGRGTLMTALGDVLRTPELLTLEEVRAMAQEVGHLQNV
ncbi:MAG: FAD-dependent oxidoreductase [Planctomycetes bacterium]|nr:FAD-dependent oxidoreductase [Planctomycetota bacterium]